MTGYTPIYNLPYPQASDLVSAYPGTGQDLAEEVETVLAAKAALTSVAVRQVVSTTKTSQFSTTSTSATDVTGLSVSITPTSATNKVLVTAYIPLGHYASATNQAAFVRILRGATTVFVGDAASTRTQAGGATSVHATDWGHSVGAFPITLSFVDSPATTSATTYKVQVWQSAGSGAFVGSSGVDTDGAAYARMPSSITVMEVLP